MLGIGGGRSPRQSDAQLLVGEFGPISLGPRSTVEGTSQGPRPGLRILDGIRVARTRVLRVMRAHGLLSPHRGRQGAAKTHDGKVVTSRRPDRDVGRSDGVRVFTLDERVGL